MTKKELLVRITDKLMQNHIFEGYRIRKGDMAIIFRTKDMYKLLDFHITSSVKGYWVTPYYSLRYEILRNWFENNLSQNHSTNTKLVTSFTFFGKKLSVQNEFDFYEDWSNFDDVFIKMEKVIVKCCDFVFSEMGNLKGCYEKIIVPLIKKQSTFQQLGFEWVIDMITLCRIVDPEAYPHFKYLILKHIERMYNAHEPNVEMYYDKLDDIFKDLESQDFSKVKID